MKAKHFFDTWMMAVDRVGSVRAGIGVHSLNPDIIRRHIGERHGSAIAEQAVTYYEQLRKDTQQHSAGTS